MTTTVSTAMYQAFCKSVMEAEGSTPQRDMQMNAIEAAIEAQHPWERFLEARVACLHHFIAEGKTMAQATRELSFHDVAHAERVYEATKHRFEVKP